MDNIQDIKFQDIPNKSQDTQDESGPEIIVLKFADSKIPVFKESRNKDYIKYGEDNLYPEYLNYLYNKSGKHNAILTGKANYIFGSGFDNGNMPVNRTGDTLNDISKKCLLDECIYGGWRIEIIWNFGGKVAEIYHVDYSSLRRGKECGFYFKESWQENNRDEEVFIESFDPKHPVGSQIYAFDAYRPGTRFYPLPDYIGSNNYIETDIEISKYYLSSIRNGMTPSKMVQFFTGEPSEDKKKAIERNFTKKFAGSENAGKFLLVFNAANAQNSVKVDDLSASDLDKHMIELNKTCQQEIFAGHLVTNPALFGIMQEGKLDGTSGTSLQVSYEIFQNTYVKPKAEYFNRELTWLMKYSKMPGIYELQPTEPIGLQFDIKDIVNSLPKEFVFKRLGIPEELWGKENIGADNRPTPTIPIAAPNDVQASSTPVNDNIKNLTGRQHQGIMRIVRQCENGKLTRIAATAMLKSGYGLSDEDVIAFLGPEPTALSLSFEDHEEEIIGMFDSCGECKSDFEVIKSKKVNFSAIDEIQDDEVIYIQEAFKTYDVTKTEQSIIDLIKSNGKLTISEIAAKVGQSSKYVESKINTLLKKGYIEGEVGKLNVPSEIKKIPPDTKKPPSVSIKYSYEGPQDSHNRPFCAKMMQLNRLYSRADIEQISERLGYSVFDRRGGFWRHKGTDVTTPYCRHRWQSNIVIKKGGNES